MHTIYLFVCQCCSCAHSGTLHRSGCGTSPLSWLCK